MKKYKEKSKENSEISDFTKLTRSGISLIVLIITIIVIIILATSIIISIISVNPIPEAYNAKENWSVMDEKEQISLAYASVFTEKFETKFTKEELQRKFDEKIGENKVKVNFYLKDIWVIEMSDTQNIYSIEYGNIEKLEQFDVSMLESKLIEYEEVINAHGKYTPSTYNTFYEQYEIAKKIVESKIANENIIVTIMQALEEKYNLLEEKKIPKLKKFEISTDGENFILKNYSGDYSEDYYEVVDHGIIFISKSQAGNRVITRNTAGIANASSTSYSKNKTYKWTYKKVISSTTIYVFKAYIQYIDSNGKKVNLYSNQVYKSLDDLIDNPYVNEF